jgi:hypothetical protein
MSKMGFHDPFGYLKHKLWPKEGSGIKLSIWFSTIKSWESPQFICMKAMCHISLKSSQRGLQLCFRHHFNQRFTKENMGFQSCRSPNFGTPTWEFQDKMTFGCWSCGHAQRRLWGGRWWLPLSPAHGEYYESYEYVFARGSSMHQKCSNYALTNLLFGLCNSVWVIDLLVTFSNPYPKAPARPFTPELLQARECTPTCHSSVVFTLDSHLSLLRSFRVRQPKACRYPTITLPWQTSPCLFLCSGFRYINWHRLGLVMVVLLWKTIDNHV